MAFASASANDAYRHVSSEPSDSTARRMAVEWPGAITSLINTTFEDGDLEEVFTAIIQNSGEAHGPSADVVLQLIAVVLEPDFCCKGQVANGRDLEEELEDPYALVSRHASLKALVILRRWIAQGLASKVLAALPRRTSITDGGPIRPRCSFTDEADDQLLPIQRLARRISLCDDIWKLLTTNLADEYSERTAGRTSGGSDADLKLSNQAWDLLSLLSEAWKQEEKDNLATEDSGVTHGGYSAGLLSQFKRPMLGDAPTDIKACLDIVLLPFQKGELEHIQRFEHCDIAFRTLSALATLAGKGKIDKTAFHDSLGEALGQLPLGAFRDFVTLCLPDQPTAKLDFLNAYLSKYAAPSTFTIPTPKDGSKPFSPIKASTSTSNGTFNVQRSSQGSQAKPSSSGPSNGRSHVASDVISIGSSDDSDDSDVVCLTPSVKTSPNKLSPVKPRAIPLASPAGKQKSLLSPTSSLQDIKPNIATILDPMLPQAADIVNKIASQIPRELMKLSPDAPKQRVHRRAMASAASDASGATSSMRHAEMRFATVKIEICRIYVAHAVAQNAKDTIESWRKVCPDALLQKGLRAARHMFKSDSGDLHETLITWQKREEVMVKSLL